MQQNHRVSETSASTTRAKSIAEKLGFINFDEEELDTPSYLRKEENSVRRDYPGNLEN